MKLEFAPLLQVQRDLYRMPRGWERFRAYLQTLVDPETKDLKLPLSAMNPMGKDHVPAPLDRYLAFDADGLAARAVAEAESRLSNVEGEFKVTLVIVDDAMGGWTNRYSNELTARSGSKPLHKRGWITGTLCRRLGRGRARLCATRFERTRRVRAGFERRSGTTKGDARRTVGCPRRRRLHHQAAWW